MYGKIARLSYKEGYCWAGNSFLDGTKTGRNASRFIAELKNTEYIVIENEGSKLRKIRICPIKSKVQDSIPDHKRKHTSPNLAGSNLQPHQEKSGNLATSGEVNNNSTSPNLAGSNLQPRQKKSGNLANSGEVHLAKFGDRTLQDSTNLNLTAAADPPETSPPDAESAATAPITLQELKEALLDVDKALILKTAFYPKAAAFMAQYGLDRGYIAWLYRQCELRKPSTSFKGLYYTLFFEEDMAEQYAAGRRATASLQPPPPIICPACGETHDPGDDKCPACGLRKDASDEEIQRFRALHLLSPDQRAEYLKREDAIYEECGKNFVKSKSMIESLNSEFGLAAGL